MSYAHITPFARPVRFNDSQHPEYDEQQFLEYFRYERNHSPMAEIMRDYLKIEASND